MFTYEVFPDATFITFAAGEEIGFGDARDIALLAEEGVLDPALRAAWEAAGFRVSAPGRDDLPSAA